MAVAAVSSSWISAYATREWSSMTVCTNAVPIFGWRCRRSWACPAVAARFRSPWTPPDVAPPAAVGDVAELLDVHVQHRPGVGVLVAAHRFPGGPVHVRQPVQPAPGQHPVHRRGCDPDVRGELDRAQAFTQPQRHDPLRDRRGCLGRHRVRPARAVLHRLPGGVPVRPALDRGVGALEPGRDLGDRLALVDDELGDPKPGLWGQGSVSVGHEGLLFGEVNLEQFHSTAGGPPMSPRHNDESHSLNQPVRSVPRPEATLHPSLGHVGCSGWRSRCTASPCWLPRG